MFSASLSVFPSCLSLQESQIFCHCLPLACLLGCCSISGHNPQEFSNKRAADPTFKTESDKDLKELEDYMRQNFTITELVKLAIDRIEFE